MDRDLLSHLPVIVAVARRRGFAAAASELGMSPSAVSHAVRVVEERLSMPLFVRTTRSVALTDAGQALVDSAMPALRDISDRVEHIQAMKGQVSGLVRVNVPTVALPIVMTPIVREMAERYPGVQIEAYLDNALSDIVEGSFDAGIRLGEMIAADMVAVRLSPPFRAIMVAAPGYLAARGHPQCLGDLADHNCITYRLIRSGGLYRWEVQEDGRDIAVECSGSVIVNDPLYARQLALAGVGLAYLFEPLVRDDIAAGTLLEVLSEAAIEEPGFFLYFPRRSAMAPKLRALIETAKTLAFCPE
ncbi:MAG: LysR family transcriptional regulator [Myxococcota bacterium]